MLVAVLSGCAPGAKVTEPLSKSSRVAIVEFADCEDVVGNNCPGSGKIASKVYSEVFEGCPILTSEADPNVKNFDAVISGKMLSYNIGTPLVGRVNYAKIDLQVKRPKDGKLVATQQDSNDASPLYGKKTEELVRGFAVDLKERLWN